MTSKETTKINPVKLPFFQTIFGCYDIFFSKFWSFVCLGGLFALIMTFIFFISGQDILCLNNEYGNNHFCTKSIWNYVGIHLIAICLNFLFMQKWVLLVTEGKSFKWKRVVMPDWGTLKMIGLSLAYIATIGVAAFSLYLLYVRVPNPNWKIELVYFTAVSVGFIFPVIGMRFFSYFAYAAQREPLPSVRVIWKKTSGNMLPIVGGCALLMFLSLFLVQTIMQQLSVAKPTMGHALFLEYLSQFFVFVLLNCFMNYCYIQKNFFEKDLEDEKKQS